MNNRIETFSKFKNDVKIEIIQKYFSESLKTKDLKIIVNAIKICLTHCMEFDQNLKNDDQLLEFMVEISKFFKSDFDFFKKIHHKGFFIDNSKFYDIWILTTSDTTEINKIKHSKDNNCKIQPIQPKSTFTQLSTFLLSFQTEISNEEFRAAIYVSNPSGNLYDKNRIDSFSKNYKSFFSKNKRDFEKDNILEDTINKTLLNVKPLQPGATPTVNIKEARGFIDELIHRPAFDSSDESEDFFTHITCKNEAKELHKSINLIDVWESPSKEGASFKNQVREDANTNATTLNRNNYNKVSDQVHPSVLTFGGITACSDNFSIDKLLTNSQSQTLVKPMIVTPFAKFKLQLNNKNSEKSDHLAKTDGEEKKNNLDQISEDTTQINFYNLAISKCTSTPSTTKFER